MASEADFYIKQGDTNPNILVQLQEDDGTVKDLTGDTVQFRMREAGGDAWDVESTATLTDSANGEIEYNWSSGDTDTAGYFNAQFRVDYGSTGTYDETFPNYNYITVKVDDI